MQVHVSHRKVLKMSFTITAPSGFPLRCSYRFICSYLLICTFVLQLPHCNGHGRLIEPPSRASAWRYGFQTPPDYNDHELYCGGFTRQWKQNDGKCGECGDAWNLPVPRPHEHGGQWGQGVIVRRYAPGAEFSIRVELTASHMGYFEFRLCPEPDGDQECLDRHLLKLLGGSPSLPEPSDLETRFYPRNGSRIYEIKAQLPDIQCSQCLLQWRYIAGNNWGICPDGNGAVGCGPQEEFRACSDISIGEGGRVPMRPIRPTFKPTMGKKPHPTNTKTTQSDQVPDNTSSHWVPVLFSILLVVLICILLAWYLNRHHGEKLKLWMESTLNRVCWKRVKESSAHGGIKSGITMPAPVLDCQPEKNSDNAPPVPPPRTKRLSRVKEMTPDESSVA